MSEVKKYKSHILAVTTNSVHRAMLLGQDPSDVTAVKNIQFSGIASMDDGLPFDVDDVVVMSRNVLEADENFKQLIPYSLIVRGGKILTYRRTKTGGESRLHGNTSIGFGGHVDSNDIYADESTSAIDVTLTLAQASSRELSEELNITGNKEGIEQYLMGLLLDESNQVGRVHVGIVLVTFLDELTFITSKEDQIELTGFRSVEELIEMGDVLENWSLMVAEKLKNMGILDVTLEKFRDATL